MSVQSMSPHDQLCAAISIIQQHILAEDTLVSAEKLFTPGGYFSSASLELAERMLMDLIPHVEHLNKPQQT
ncbi:MULTISPECIES: hypothetical protein [unclassified Roseovarius]|uniref:hypothetical protein n=1 Tax=unclassified Roseovarius TaxID=2614913 RepID=UPI00273D96DA|nr:MULTISPECIES: hypothetical protein [unclassified Roseovarius]